MVLFIVLFFIWSWKSWNWWFWVVLKGSHPRHYARNDVCRVFVSQEKKHFFMKKYFSHFALLYGSARVEPDHENHQFSWKTMIFIDFHWFWSKIMKIDGFRCSWTSPASGIRSETVCVAFLKSIRKSIFFMKKYFSALCTTLRLCSEPRPVIKIINFHEKAWFSLIFIDFGQIDDFDDRARLWA